MEGKKFEHVEKLRYLGPTITRNNGIMKGIEARLKAGNACYFSVARLLASSIPKLKN